MSGHRPWSEIRTEVESKPGAREEIDAIKRAMDDVLRLAELRHELHITQEELARALDVSQSNVSRIERAEDLYLSTLRGYVEALGGKLEINAVFPERTIPLTSGH
jgi:DNA-binding XRE family transcriptional regulator